MNGSTSVDTPAMAVLAALSHEYGHILWYDVLKANPSNYSPNSFCRQTGIGFFDNAWITPINTPLPWLFFGETTTVDGRTDRHTGTIQIQDLKNAITGTPPDFQTAAKLLNAFYASDVGNPDGVWPSLFGAISPEEDFVETFRVYILSSPATNMGMPVISMPLNIYSTPLEISPRYTPNIFANLASNVSKPELLRKRACIDRAFSLLTPSVR
jgi:hypothetical protein